MAQEGVTQPDSHVRAFHQTGNVCQHHVTVADNNDPQIRFERRERVGRDLGFSIADDGEQSRFASIRHTDDANIGNELEFKLDMVNGTWLSSFRESRGLVSWRRTARVATASAPARSNHHFLIRYHKVCQQRACVGIMHHSSKRNLNANIICGSARLAGTCAIAAPICGEMLAAAERNQGIDCWRGNQNYAATPAAVAAIGTTAWNI